MKIKKASNMALFLSSIFFNLKKPRQKNTPIKGYFYLTV